MGASNPIELAAEIVAAFVSNNPLPKGELPEFWGEVQPPASLKGLDIPSRRAVFVPWKPSRRRGSEWETRLSAEEPMLSTGLHLTSESTIPLDSVTPDRALEARRRPLAALRSSQAASEPQLKTRPMV